MKSAGILLVTLVLAACQPLILTAPEPAPKRAEPPVSTQLPGMPSWVKFVRFPSHAHKTDIALEQAPPVTGSSITYPVETLVFTEDETGAVSDSTALTEATTDGLVDTVPVNTLDPCNGRSSYVHEQDENWLAARDPDRWTIQIVSANDATEPCIDDYLDALDSVSPPFPRRLSVFHQSAIWNIAIVGDYPTVELALAAAKAYHRPWVRRFGDLRERRCRSIQFTERLRAPLAKWCGGDIRDDHAALRDVAEEATVVRSPKPLANGI